MSFEHGYLLSLAEIKKPTTIEVGWNKMHHKYAGGRLRGNLPSLPSVEAMPSGVIGTWGIYSIVD
jgi:hypothetical protein